MRWYNCVIYIIIILLLIGLIWPKESFAITPQRLREFQLARAQPGQRIGRYLFYQHMGFSGFLLMERLDLAGDHGRLMAISDTLPNCAGFDSSGKFYTMIIPRYGWYIFFPTPDQGLFVKDMTFAPVNMSP